MQCIEKGDADLILEIPPHFERDLLKTGAAKSTEFQPTP